MAPGSLLRYVTGDIPVTLSSVRTISWLRKRREGFHAVKRVGRFLVMSPVKKQSRKQHPPLNRAVLGSDAGLPASLPAKRAGFE